jgi:hypothetical protein
MFRFLSKLLSLSIFLSSAAGAQVEEPSVDFAVNPTVLRQGKVHVAFEWLTPESFRQKSLSVIDVPKINSRNAGNQKLTASKVAFISNRSFDDLSYDVLNQASFIKDMFGAIAIDQLSADSWRLTNRVNAYRVNFRLGFNLRIQEASERTLPAGLVRFLRNEARGIPSQGRERFILIDMDSFSQLIYRNYSIIYMRELSDGKVVIVGGVVAGVNANRANFYFPFGTEAKMVNEMRTQVLLMARKIKG